MAVHEKPDIPENMSSTRASNSSRSVHDSHDDIMFSPPLYQQRYSAVKDLIKNVQAKKVIDMGCGECQMLRKLKSESTIEHLIGVDIDRSCLESSEFHIKPLTTDYLHPRSQPLVVQLFQGSIANYDSGLHDFDFIAFVEVIEHLHPEELEKIPETMFGLMKPKTVLITTPNAEFNVLFSNFEGFRHWDHKFEWTRKEFQEWCEKVSSKYPYTVTYTGVGLGPPGKEHLGYCTQMAQFTRLHKEQTENLDQEQIRLNTSESYKLIAEAIHPYNIVTEDEMILNEAIYHNRLLARDLLEEHDQEVVMVALDKLCLCHRLSKICRNVERLRKIIKASEKLKLTVDENAIINYREYDSDSLEDDEWESLQEIEIRKDVQATECWD